MTERSFYRGFRSTRWAIAALCVGCQSSADLASGGAGGTGGAGGSAPDAGVGATAIAFDPPSLTLLPGQARTVRVQLAPRASLPVRFTLEGEASDASLDRGDALTDADGVTEVTVTGSSDSNAFVVKAVSGATTARLSVSVSDAGFARVSVTPSYGGTRAISAWTASVHVGTTCAELPGIPPPDGPLLDVALVGTAPEVRDVPAGQRIAVTVRAGYFAGGCAELASAPAGEVVTVLVPVSNRPIDLAATNLDVDLDLAASAGFEHFASGASSDALSVLGSDDVAALLDAVVTASSDPSLVATLRVVSSWDDALRQLWGNSASQHLREGIAAWLAAGAAAAPRERAIRAHLVSDGAAPRLTLLEAFGRSPAAFGFASESPPDLDGVGWQADPSDAVLLGARLRFFPSLFLAELADGELSNGAVAALAERAQCSAFSTLVDVSGAACDGACATDLCTAAVAALWQRVRDSSAESGRYDVVDLTASGPATVDDHARPEAFSGQWIGVIGAENAGSSVGGAARGFQVDDAPP